MNILLGRYEEKDPNPKKWKANFRCAINSLPDVKEDKDKSQSRGPNAYKVYKLLKEKKSRRKTSLCHTGRFVYCVKSPTQRLNLILVES